jgi:putative peptidyl-prolyl cis-trans isomerase
MKYKLCILPILIIMSTFGKLYSWEEYDKVIATVNESPIIESELNKKFDLAQSKSRIPDKNPLNLKSRLLDSMIDQAIVEQTAEKESIIISASKVDDRIQKIMESMNIKNKDEFVKAIEKTEKITINEYKEELKKFLIRDQVMSIAIGANPPTDSEAMEFYEKNKKEMGNEINMQHIMLALKDDSFGENKRVNEVAKDIFNRVQKGESFAVLAAKYSDDQATKNNEGRMGWIIIQNLAAADPVFANNIYKEFFIDKKKTAVIKSNSAYHVIKLIEKRVTAFESVKDYILNMLYQKNLADQFKKWADRKKSESDIKIYMESYVPEKV